MTDRTPADVARDALRRARERASQQPAATRGGSRRRPRPGMELRSGPGPDERDPQRFAAAASRLLADRGWQEPLHDAAVFGQWESIVGPEVASHARPESLTGGVLTVVAESTAWATQLRLLARSLLARIAAEVGPQVVRQVRVKGPAVADWRHGPLRVVGRGPRDTYG